MKKNNIVSLIIIYLILTILGIMFFNALDKSYTNRAKAAGYYCAECLTDTECIKFCSK